MLVNALVTINLSDSDYGDLLNPNQNWSFSDIVAYYMEHHTDEVGFSHVSKALLPHRSNEND